MMIAQDMLTLAEKHKKCVNEIHKIFYEVSCDRDQLIKVLEGDKQVVRWSVLEDLALKGKQENEAYQHVMHTMGERETHDRAVFLGIR
jgi:hypothetical protein